MKRKRGRPPLDPGDPSVGVTFKLPASKYAALVRHAGTVRQSLGNVIRLAIKNSKIDSPAN